MPPQQNVWTCEPDRWTARFWTCLAWPDTETGRAFSSWLWISENCNILQVQSLWWIPVAIHGTGTMDTEWYSIIQMWTTTAWVWVLLLNGHWSQATKRGKHKSAQDITRTYKHSINFDFWLHLRNSWQISFNIHWHHRRCTAVSCLWDRPGRLVSIQQADFLALTACWNNDLQYQLTPKLGFTYLSPGTRGTTAPCTWESNNRTVCSNSSWISNQVLDIIVSITEI